MFKEIVGNEPIKKMLEQAIKSKRVSHSYLFVGISGIGKKKLAIEFAKTILCQTNNNCNVCKSCLEFNGNNNPDFNIIEPQGNSIKIEQIRELQKRIQEKPIVSNKKVYIIDNADQMTNEAQNCFLKTLEEPPEFVTIILIGSNESSFLTTIKSRCMILHFNPISNNELKTYLETHYEMESITENMLDIFQGSIGKAILLKEKKETYIKIEKIVESLSKEDIIEVIKSAEILYQAKEEIFEILDYINIILLKYAKQNKRYTNCIKIVENTKKRLKQNANYDMSIDNMIFNLWEEVN